MNASTFFSQDDFNAICNDANAQKEIPIHPIKYGKQVKTNGNTYTLRISAGFYKFGDCSYYISLWYDYNYPGLYESRNIGGGSGGRVVLSSYEDFCQDINELLKKYPDYTEQQYEPEQISWF